MLAALGGAVLNTVLLVQITRGYGRAAAGTFFVVTAFFLIGTSAAALGADTGVLRYIARARALRRPRDAVLVLRAALIPAAGLSVVLAVVIEVLAPRLSGLLGSAAAPQFRTAIRVMAPFLPVAVAYNVLLAATRGYGAMRPTALVERVGRVAVQCVAVATVQLLSGHSMFLLCLAWAAPYLAGLAVAIAWLRRLHGRRYGVFAASADQPTEMRSSDDDVTPREFWRFSAFRGVSRLFAVALQRLDVILVGSLRGPRDAAVYAAASRFLIVGLMAVQAIQQVTAPKMSQLLATQSHRRATVAYQTSTTWLMASTWPLYLSFAVFAPTLLQVFGSGYSTGAVAVSVLCSAMLVSTACGSVDSILLMAGRSSWSVLNTGCALTTNVVADLILIPRHGILGAAIGWALAILVNNLLPLTMISRAMDMRPFSGSGRDVALLSVGCFGVLPLVARIVLGISVPVVTATVALATVLYGLGLYARRRSMGLDELAAALRRSRGPALLQ
jgi:O-antigen/teichoic acid export membrane protein